MMPTTQTVDQESVETSERILVAAERLFSRRGFEATSVRDITTEADCNVAAVNYHFGSKEKLYLATFRSLLREVRDRRIASIRRAMADNPEMDLEGFVTSFAHAFVEPLVDEGRGRHFMGFLAHELLDPRLPANAFTEEFIRPLAEISVEGLEKTGPPMDPLRRRLCLMSIVGQLVHAIHARQVFSGSEQQLMVPSDPKILFQHIVEFSVGGIEACAMENPDHGERLATGSEDDEGD
jgi:AcrR family transcriptional regulator